MTIELRQWQATDAEALLRAPRADSNKYSRGVLGVRAGSSAYPGAAVLAVEAAWRTGIGMVRYSPAIDDEAPTLGLPGPAAAVLAARPETVFLSEESLSEVSCDAWLLGSGTDPARRSAREHQTLLRLLGEEAPLVIDAGALDIVLSGAPAAPVIITPHWGEFVSLWGRADMQNEAPLRTAATTQPEALEDRAEAAATLARRLGVTVLLKGSHTVVASPHGRCLVYGPATPWLATAGTGDVLAGVLGAILAANSAAVRQNPELLVRAGATASALHDRAARIAAGDEPEQTSQHRGTPIVALDVARSLPRAHLSVI